MQLTGRDGVSHFDTAYPRREPDGVARLHLQVFLLHAGQVVGAALAHLAMPGHITALAHGRELQQPTAWPPAEGTPSC
jgi:hypothetical protein